jgi:hypothetical protein
MEYLKILQLSAARISRRPSLKGIPLNDVYFVEALDGSSSEIPAWKATVEKAVERVSVTGAEVALMGIW